MIYTQSVLYCLSHSPPMFFIIRLRQNGLTDFLTFFSIDG